MSLVQTTNSAAISQDQTPSPPSSGNELPWQTVVPPSSWQTQSPELSGKSGPGLTQRFCISSAMYSQFQYVAHSTQAAPTQSGSTGHATGDIRMSPGLP